MLRRLSSPAPARTSSNIAAARQPSGGAARIAAKSVSEPARTREAARQTTARAIWRSEVVPPSTSKPAPRTKPSPASTVVASAASGNGAVSAQGVTRNNSRRKLAPSGSSARCHAAPASPIGSSSVVMPPVTRFAAASTTTAPQMPMLPAVTTRPGRNRLTAARNASAAISIASSIRTTGSPARGATRSPGGG